MSKKAWKRLLWGLFIGYMVYSWLKFHIVGPKPLNPTQDLPSPDPSKQVYVYDLYENKWIYRDERFGKTQKSHPSDLDGYRDILNRLKKENEKALQEYLEEHLDGYKEKTYWGEEWEFDDIEDPEDEEDLELER